MAYSTNSRLPRLRAEAAEMVRQGRTVSEVARYFGYTKSAVSKWCKKMPPEGARIIPTRSSRPHHSPRALPKKMVASIIAYKKKYKRCSEVIHQHLANDGIRVSLNSVKRKLDDAGLINKRSPWKRLHLSEKRPDVQKPGDLVMVDTIHLPVGRHARIYVYTLIDVHSRWCFAWATNRISTRNSVRFLERAHELASFQFACIQSDHGPEFSQHFTERIKILHRHSRVRKPNDNAHLERFNRTIQEECLRKYPQDVTIFNKALPRYLMYYNTERLHMGLNFKTPAAIIKRFQAIG